MYCPNCGKEIKESDNFCRYCGCNLKNETVVYAEEKSVENDEEFVLYEVTNHWRRLLLPIILIPLFIFYFWNIFLNTHSFFSWVVVAAILGLIIYHIGRYKSDSMVITNKFIHIKAGVLNPEQVDIPIENIDMISVVQSTFGRIFDYGRVTVENKFDFGYVQTPEDLQYIIDEPKEFIKEALN